MILGLAIGIRISLHVNDTPFTDNVIILQTIITLLFGFGFFIISEFVGTELRSKHHTKMKNKELSENKKPHKVDKYLGLPLGLLAGTLFILIGSSFILVNPTFNSQDLVLKSKVLTYINEHSLFGLTIDSSFHFIDPEHELQITTSNQIAPFLTSASSNQYDLPTSGPFLSAINKDYKSVVLLDWQGCNELHYGTGFVYSPDYIITAAHVVAGAGLVRVSDKYHAYLGKVVLFDESDDLAVLYVPNLPDAPLTINTSHQPVGTQTTLLGYKEAGPLSDGIGPVIDYDRFANLKVDISEAISINANTYFYEVNSISNLGDSGAPLILNDGSVIGHLSFVYFQNPGQDSHGLIGPNSDYSYFVSASNYTQEINSAKYMTKSVNTESCIT